jgi:hypothetical protein
MAAVSKSTFKMGTLRLVDGKALAMTDQQEAGMTTMVFFPRAWRAYRMDSDAPQPGHATCPE